MFPLQKLHCVLKRKQNYVKFTEYKHLSTVSYVVFAEKLYYTNALFTEMNSGNTTFYDKTRHEYTIFTY